MSGIRLDKVVFSTLHEAYKNYANLQDSYTFFADILPDGFSQNYPVDGLGDYVPMIIPYSRGGTRADIYLEGNDVKVLANGATRLETGDPYQFISSETFSVIIEYTSADIRITFNIFNGTGGSITLIPQTISVLVVEYDAPITPI